MSQVGHKIQASKHFSSMKFFQNDTNLSMSSYISTIFQDKGNTCSLDSSVGTLPAASQTPNAGASLRKEE